MLACVLLADLGLGDRGDAVEPGQRVGDLVGFEAHGSELPGQLLVSGAGVGTPVVLVEVHEHVEHEKTIPQRLSPMPRQGRTARCRRCPARGEPQPRSTRWKRWPGRRATRPCSSKSSSRADRSAALWPVRAISSSRPIGSKPSASRIGILGGRWRALSRRRRRRHARDARERRQLVDDVVGAVDQLGALLDERVAAARLRRVDRAGDREDVAAGLERQPRRDQRARLHGGLDDERAARERRDDAVPDREVLRQRRRADRELADQEAVGGDLLRRARDAGPGRRRRARCRRRRSCRRRRRARLRAPRRRCRAPARRRRPSRRRRGGRRRRARSRGLAAVALRLPTIAIAGRSSSSMRPRT